MNQPGQTNGQSILIQGRLVWIVGRNLAAGEQQKDDQTKQLLFNQDGSPKISYGFGLAVPKINPATGQFTEEFTALWQMIQREALTQYPTGQVPQDFAWKYKDGDVAVDKSGQPYSKREGYANHLVLSCTTMIPFKLFRFENGNNMMVNDGFKCGDYVRVQLNIKAHPPVGRGKPGLYLNPSAVQFIQAGKEIINTPSGDQIFGMNMPSYAGQVVAPVAPPMPNVAAPAPAYPGQAPMPGQGYQQQPQQAPPYHGVLPPQHQPMQAPMPNVAPPAPAYPGQASMPGQGYPAGNGYAAMPGAPAPSYPTQAPMPGAPAANGQTQYPPMNTAGQMVPGQQYAPTAYPSNGLPPMPGMPR